MISRVDCTGSSKYQLCQWSAMKTRPLRLNKILVHKGKEGKGLLPPAFWHSRLFFVGGGWMCSFVSVIGKPEVRGLTWAAGHTKRLPGPTWYAAGSRGGREEGRGASVSVNLVGRWLTSPCPSKCDLGRTFNEIHSTWQAPPLPGLSVWSLFLFQSDFWLHVLLLCGVNVSLCLRAFCM